MNNKKINAIELVINDKEEFCNSFNNKKLSSDLGNYIYNESLIFNRNESFQINIKTKFDLAKNEKNEIVDMIREYFGLRIRETINYYKFNRIKKILLFLLGIILITISHFVSVNNEFLISEVFLIIGWVAIWEVFDNILLVETKKKFKLNRYKKLVNCKINFENK